MSKAREFATLFFPLERVTAATRHAAVSFSRTNQAPPESPEQPIPHRSPKSSSSTKEPLRDAHALTDSVGAHPNLAYAESDSAFAPEGPNVNASPAKTAVMRDRAVFRALSMRWSYPLCASSIHP